MKTRSLKANLFGVFAVLSLLIALVGGFGVYSLNVMLGRYHTASSEMLPKTFASSELRAVVQAAARYFVTLANPAFTDEKSREEVRKQIVARFERVEKAFAKMEAFPLTKEEKEIVEEWKMSWSEEKAILEKASLLVKPEDLPQLQQLAGTDLWQIMNKMNAIAAKVKKVLDDETQAQAIIAETSSARDLKIAMGLVLAVIFLSLSISWKLGTRLSSRLSSVAGQFDASVEQVAHDSRGMAESSLELANSSNLQAESLQATATAVEEIQQTVKLTAENAVQSVRAAELTVSSAQRGKSHVEEMVLAMEKIMTSNQALVDQFKESNREISDVANVIREIDAKTRVINDIVFQTKLLSFNASVEAARAGEQGKGFAVVAEEVGALASLSGSAAKEITDMLSASTQRVNSIVSKSTEKLNELVKSNEVQVQEGVQIARKSGDVLEEVVQQVENMKVMSDHVSSASDEQKIGLESISTAVAKLNTVSVQNKVLSEKSSQLSDTFKERTAELGSKVQELRVLIRGSDAA